MRAAQLEIKATVSVNTGDSLANKTPDDSKDTPKDESKRKSMYI